MRETAIQLTVFLLVHFWGRGISYNVGWKESEGEKKGVRERGRERERQRGRERETERERDRERVGEEKERTGIILSWYITLHAYVNSQ